MGIGNKLNELLTEKQMTVAELSKRIHVAPTTIYSIIQRNNKKVDIDVLLDIADVLGVDAEYFRDSPKPSSDASSAGAETFTPEELKKIEEYKKLLLAARPRGCEPQESGTDAAPAAAFIDFPEHLTVNAAHARTGATQEELQSDEDLMDNDDEWK